MIRMYSHVLVIQMGKLFGTVGIRGIANEKLDPNLAIKVGYAIGTYFNKKTIVVGRDARTSSPMIANAITSGILSTGTNVIYIDVSSVPLLSFSIRHFCADAGVLISASHNPPEYNGIKVWDQDGILISHDIENKLEDIIFAEKGIKAAWNEIGSYSEENVPIDEYIDFVSQFIDVEAIKKQKMKVILDCGNGAGAIITPKALRKLNCEVTTINAQLESLRQFFIESEYSIFSFITFLAASIE